MSITLPLRWYFTPAELGHEWGCHSDAVLYFVDAGYITPAALVPKASLPKYDVLGPSPYLVVPLPNYREMTWVHGEDSTAPLTGEFKAFEVDGERTQNFVFDAASALYVSRRDLVITLDQKEQLEALGTAGKRMPNQERRTLLTLIYYFAIDAGSEERVAKPYSLASDVQAELMVRYGVSMSRETIASKLKEAKTVIDCGTKSTEKPNVRRYSQGIEMSKVG